MSTSNELHYDWTWDLPASAEALWPLVSDTNRFNRDAGLPPVVDARSPDEVLANARRKLRLRVKGVLLEWEEFPFEWLRPYAFGVIRRYSVGPLKEMRVQATLEPLGSGTTRLRYRVSARPRGLFGAVTTPIQIGFISRMTFGRTFKRYARSAAAGVSGPVSTPEQSAPIPHRVARIHSTLADGRFDSDLVDRLVQHVLAADDLSLARIRPYALANAWGSSKREVLRLCLEATRSGLLDLSWDVMCPKCMGAKDQASTLRDLRTGIVHCDTCLVDFEADFDQSVEVSFSPCTAVRTVSAPPFCVAGPQITPHVEVQQLLSEGESRTVEALLTGGRHRARAWGIPGGPSFLVQESGAPNVTLRITEDEEWQPVTEPVAPDATITLVNGTKAERLIDIERIIWGDDAATAAEVTALSDFRDIFASEVLDAGHFIGVGNLAVLFTDLRDSTKLYRAIGDAPAFGRVMKHFDVLTDAVSLHNGGLVKTIGDAVMAVFREPADALRAVRTAQDGLARSDDPLVLKAGIHFGPCIAVNQNDRLDYFGTTVNIAARLGGLSAGNDIVISDEMRRDEAVESLLMQWGASTRSFDANVRGVEGELRVWRITSAALGEESP